MRLIDADVLKSKIREQPWKQETKVSLMLDWIYMLIDEASTVSTVQNKALQQENEQLQTQAARMKNAIQYVLYHLRRGGKSWIIDKLEPAISDTPAEYHNPADVEALRKARNLLQRYKDHIKSYPCECKFGLDFYGNKTPFRDGEMCERCAELAEIDKAIGGKEDA